MKILSFIKKLFGGSTGYQEPDRRNLDLANMSVEPGTTELKVEAPFVGDVAETPVTTNEVSVAEESNRVTELIAETEAADEEVNKPDVLIEEKKPEIKSANTSLLDNKPFMAITESLNGMLDELEDDVNDMSSQEVFEIVKSRVQEGLLLSGAELISEDKKFDVLRHKPVPAAMVKKGTPIEGTLEAGIVIGDKVIRKAKVQIKKG